MRPRPPGDQRDEAYFREIAEHAWSRYSSHTEQPCGTLTTITIITGAIAGALTALTYIFLTERRSRT